MNSLPLKSSDYQLEQPIDAVVSAFEMVCPHVLLMANFSSFCIHWFFFERHTRAWLHLMETLDELPAASSPTGERRLRSHWITPGTGHRVLDTGNDKASRMLLAVLPFPPAASCCLLPTSLQASGKTEHSSFSLCSSHQLQPLPLTLPFSEVGNLKAHSQARNKVYWSITRLRHNSGELGEMLVFFYHFRN